MIHVYKYAPPDYEIDGLDVWRTWYDKYLKSKVWRAKRTAVMHRAKGVCEACGEAPPQQVHHLTYDRVGREPLFDLVAVCRECHEQLTQWGRE